jgi:hypothetical protein
MAKDDCSPEDKGYYRAKAERDADQGRYESPYGMGVFTGKRELAQKEVYDATHRERTAYNKYKRK